MPKRLLILFIMMTATSAVFLGCDADPSRREEIDVARSVNERRMLSFLEDHFAHYSEEGVVGFAPRRTPWSARQVVAVDRRTRMIYHVWHVDVELDDGTIEERKYYLKGIGSQNYHYSGVSDWEFATEEEYLDVRGRERLPEEYLVAENGAEEEEEEGKTRETPQEFMDRYFHAVYDHDFDAMKSMSADELAAQISMAEALGGEISNRTVDYRIDSVEHEGDGGAVYNYTYIREDGSEISSTFVVVNDGGEWVTTRY